jgi:hypothetical protein
MKAQRLQVESGIMLLVSENASLPRKTGAPPFGSDALARFPIRWHHLIEKNSRQFKNLEHVLVGKAGPLFRDML